MSKTVARVTGVVVRPGTGGVNSSRALWGLSGSRSYGGGLNSWNSDSYSERGQHRGTRRSGSR
ncbi:hypothetical protein [Streptomyces acidicola]|uniref:hypothetical protein n=1 Tax=Streptomyces acidicola TaxID=2596892 RepID=UPI00128CF12A|nr:hypothetical protein [Streptomyces acidicola]